MLVRIMELSSSMPDSIEVRQGKSANNAV